MTVAQPTACASVAEAFVAISAGVRSVAPGYICSNTLVAHGPAVPCGLTSPTLLVANLQTSLPLFLVVYSHALFAFFIRVAHFHTKHLAQTGLRMKSDSFSLSMVAISPLRP